MLYTHTIYFLTCAEPLLYHTTSSEILQIDTHKRTPVSRANMMKFCYSIKVVVITYYHAVVKIGCSCCTQWRILLSFKQKMYHFLARSCDTFSACSTNFASRFFFKFSRSTQLISGSFHFTQLRIKAKPFSGVAAVTTLIVYPNAWRKTRTSSRLRSTIDSSWKRSNTIRCIISAASI